MRLGFYLVLLLASCAAAHPRANLPGTFGAGEPLPPPVAPTPPSEAGTASPPVAAPVAPATAAADSDPGAEADFVNAKARFDAGDRPGARSALQGFLDVHPASPLTPAATLMLARVALLEDDPAAAAKRLEPLAATPPDPATGGSARYYLGLADARLGHFAQARTLLLPFLPPPGASSPGDEALVELRGALAEASAGLGETAAALELWDGYARGGRDYEKAFARTRATELGADVSPEAAAKMFAAASEGGMARAVLGAKATAFLRDQGDVAGARAADAETASARREMGFEDATAAAKGEGAGDPGRLGLAVALSGKFQPVGEAVVRAAMLAAGAPGGANGAVDLYVRDAGGDAERNGKGTAELARDAAVIGIVAAGNPAGFDGMLAAVAEAAVPTLLLEDGSVSVGVPAFRLVHSSSARARALARAALQLGAREFSIVGPDSPSGAALRRSFRQAVTTGGGRITAEVTYAPGATSFTATVAAVKKTPCEVVFVADNADRLELIAPALAAADLWSAPWGAPRPPASPGKTRPRNVMILSTAADLSPKLLQNAGRYVQGALLAPGFYADVTEARTRAFVEAYRAAYGQDPHATEAYAFDGVNLLRAAVGGGARTRSDVARSIDTGTFPGLTGDIRFAGDHTRIDPPRIYSVAGDDIKTVR